MDDIMLMLFNLLKILVVVTIAVIILTYLYNLVVGRKRQSKEEQSLIERKEAAKKREVEEKLKTRTKKKTSSDLSLSHSTDHREHSRSRSRSSRDSKVHSSDFAKRITLTETERSKRQPVITITKPEEIAATKFDEKRVRSKKKKVSPRMEVVYIKKNYFSKPVPVKVFK